MVNGSNEESMLLVIMPQVVEELKMGLVPQPQAQLVVGLFTDQKWYQWKHVWKPELMKSAKTLLPLWKN